MNDRRWLAVSRAGIWGPGRNVRIPGPADAWTVPPVCSGRRPDCHAKKNAALFRGHSYAVRFPGAYTFNRRPWGAK